MVAFKKRTPMLLILPSVDVAMAWSFQPLKNDMPTLQSKPKKQLESIGTIAASLAVTFSLVTTIPANAIESSLVEGQIPPLNPSQRRYATVISSGTPEEVSAANEALLDHAVGTINTMYFDNTGGSKFDTKRMYSRWGTLRAYAKGGPDALEKFKKAELRRIQREQADWIEINDGSVNGEHRVAVLDEVAEVAIFFIADGCLQ